MRWQLMKSVCVMQTANRSARAEWGPEPSEVSARCSTHLNELMHTTLDSGPQLGETSRNMEAPGILSAGMREREVEL